MIRKHINSFLYRSPSRTKDDLQITHSLNPRSPYLELPTLRFLKSHRKGETRFSCKNGRLSIEGSRHIFELVMYKFWSNNAPYSACLSFIMFAFLLTPIDTWNCYSFELNPSLVLLIKVFLKEKACEGLEEKIRMEERPYR